MTKHWKLTDADSNRNFLRQYQIKNGQNGRQNTSNTFQNGPSTVLIYTFLKIKQR